MKEWFSFFTPSFALMMWTAFIGLALHVAMKWQAERDIHCKDEILDKKSLTFREFLKHRPAQISVMVIATVGTFTVAYAVGWLNPGLAFATGYMGSSLADNFAKKFSDAAHP